MKNTKLLVLTAFTALTLTGCGNTGSPAALPGGGQEVNVKTEEGKATMKARLEGMAETYETFDLTALGLKVESKDINFNANGKLESNFGNFEGKLGLENFGGNLEVALGEAPVDEMPYLGARITLGQTTGKVALDGKVQLAGSEDNNPVKQSIDLSGALMNAYLYGDKFYIDGSDASVLSIVDRASGFANGIVSDLDLNLVEIAALAKMLGYDLSAIFSKDQKSFDFKNAYETYTNGGKGYIKSSLTVPWMMVPPIVKALVGSLKKVNEESGKSPIDEFVTGYTMLDEKISGLQFKTYGEKGFGFQFDLSKEGLTTAITAFAEENGDEEDKANAQKAVEDINKFFNKMDLCSSIYINEQGLLETIATYINVEANIKLGEEDLAESPLSSVDFVLTAKENTKISVCYNDAVELKIPSAEQLATYKEIVLPGQNNEGEE